MLAHCLRRWPNIEPALSQWPCLLRYQTHASLTHLRLPRGEIQYGGENIEMNGILKHIRERYVDQGMNESDKL